MSCVKILLGTELAQKERKGRIFFETFSNLGGVDSLKRLANQHPIQEISASSQHLLDQLHLRD